MNRKFIWLGLSALVLALGGCRSAGKAGSTVQVERRTISQEVVFSAQVLPFNAVSGKAGVDGHVASIDRIPGIEVGKGDTIAHIRDTDNRLRPLVSASSGTLLAIRFAPGQLVNANDVFYLIGDPGKKVIQAEIDEIDARKLKVGQAFVLEAEGNELRGTISFVNSLGTETPAGIRFKVAGAIDDPKNLIALMGVTLPVKVVLGRADSVLTVEKQAVLTKGEKHFVRLSQGERTIEKEVRIGLEDERFVEISGDVHENDRIVVGG